MRPTNRMLRTFARRTLAFAFLLSALAFTAARTNATQPQIAVEFNSHARRRPAKCHHSLHASALQPMAKELPSGNDEECHTLLQEELRPGWDQINPMVTQAQG